MSTEFQQAMPPGLMFRSFLLIAGAYIGNFVCLFLAGYVVAKTFFPESFAIINSDPAIYDSIMKSEPEKIFPPEMLWMLLVVAACACAVLGYIVARLAPFAKFSHAIFFAGVLFAGYLQFAIGAQPPLQTMLVLFMAASPVAALLGANFFLRSISQVGDDPNANASSGD